MGGRKGNEKGKKRKKRGKKKRERKEVKRLRHGFWGMDAPVRTRMRPETACYFIQLCWK